jgi:outer membrane murein-binding lipoprotein Lpp
MKILCVFVSVIASTSFLPSSCTSKSDEQEAKINELQSHLQNLATAFEAQKGTKEQLESRVVDADARLQDVQNRLKAAEEDKEKIQQTLIKLEQEFSQYKERYKVSVHQKIPGIPIGEIEFEGKKYRAAEVRSISDESIGLLHSGGVVRVKPDQLPAALRENLAIDQTTPVHSETITLIASMHSKRPEISETTAPTAVNNAGTSVAKTSMTTGNGGFDENALRSVAVVTTDTGSGSGFIAREAGAFYFYTNFHVIDGASRGKAVSTKGDIVVLPSEVEVADEMEAFDLVRFRVSAPRDAKPLDIATAQDEVRAGEKIIALGNSGGAGVIPLLQGHIKATGPYAVEIDAEVIQGNSGGPVLRDGTNVVLGVVTKAISARKDYVVKDTRFDAVRRICLRPDKIKKWRPTTLRKLLEEPKQIEQIEIDNIMLKRLTSARFTPQGISGIDSDSLLSGGTSPIAAAIAAELRRTNAFLDRGKTKVAVATVKDQVGRWAKLVQSYYGSGVDGVEPTTYSRFNRDAFVRAAENRKAICSNVNQHFASEMTKLWQWAPQ